MDKKFSKWLQIVLDFLSLFLALPLAQLTNVVGGRFDVMLVLITLSEWLAIKVLGKTFE